MYNYSVWPGAYSFKSDLKGLFKWFRAELAVLLVEIEKIEKIIR